MRSNPDNRNKDKWCHFHNDHGHYTNDCRALKEMIEDLINRGYLREFVQGRERRASPRRDHPTNARDNRGPPQNINYMEEDPHQGRLVINTIAGGPVGGDSTSSRRAYARRVNSVHSTQSKRPKFSQDIVFTTREAEELVQPHSDPLVVTLPVANYSVKRTLVDNGSSTDLLFYDTFRSMKMEDKVLKTLHTPLVGLAGEVVVPEGYVTLPVLFGTQPQQVQLMVW